MMGFALSCQHGGSVFARGKILQGALSGSTVVLTSCVFNRSRADTGVCKDCLCTVYRFCNQMLCGSRTAGSCLSLTA